jgi:hypothetical protein
MNTAASFFKLKSMQIKQLKVSCKYVAFFGHIPQNWLVVIRLHGAPRFSPVWESIIRQQLTKTRKR